MNNNVSTSTGTGEEGGGENVTGKAPPKHPSTSSSATRKKRKLDDDGGDTAAAKVKENRSEKQNTLSKVLALFTPKQIKDLLVETAISSEEIFDSVLERVYADTVTRKIFVRGIPWDKTKEDLEEFFSEFGDVETTAIIVDKKTGKSKGFGFVTFNQRSCAMRALSKPSKEFGGRTIVCNLAALGDKKNQNNGPHHDGSYKSALHTSATTANQSFPHHRPQSFPPSFVVGGVNGRNAEGGRRKDDRKIFVRGLNWETTEATLRATFSAFGEIEIAAVCTEKGTGKSKGFGFVTFATAEGARAALVEEAKVIDGRTTHCNLAIVGKHRKSHDAVGGHHRPHPPMNGRPPYYAPPPPHHDYMFPTVGAYGTSHQRTAPGRGSGHGEAMGGGSYAPAVASGGTSYDHHGIPHAPTHYPPAVGQQYYTNVPVGAGGGGGGGGRVGGGAHSYPYAPASSGVGVAYPPVFSPPRRGAYGGAGG